MATRRIAFSIVDPSEGREAYQWHRGFASANEHLFPRGWEQYEAIANDGRVICARDGKDYLGLAYFTFDEPVRTWEIGGLMVAASQRKSGIGSTLSRVRLAHLLFSEDPLSRSERVITHVHADNKDPRGIVEGLLRFRHTKTIKVPGAALPGLKTDADGNVNGDEFEITKASLAALADWCESWKGTLKDGSSATIECGFDITMTTWATAFRDMEGLLA